MTVCEFELEGTCQVSTLLVGLPVLLDEKACAACRTNKNPMAINSVTCSRAAWAARKANKPIPPETINCVKAAQAEGPGTELKKMLLRIAGPTEGCGCDARANMMNIWGPDICEQRVDEIVGWLREEAHKKWAASKFLPIDFVIKRIVARAIKRARRKMLRDQPKNQARPLAGLRQPLA